MFKWSKTKMRLDTAEERIKELEATVERLESILSRRDGRDGKKSSKELRKEWYSGEAGK